MCELSTLSRSSACNNKIFSSSRSLVAADTKRPDDGTTLSMLFLSPLLLLFCWVSVVWFAATFVLPDVAPPASSLTTFFGCCCSGTMFVLQKKKTGIVATL